MVLVTRYKNFVTSNALWILTVVILIFRESLVGEAEARQAEMAGLEDRY